MNDLERFFASDHQAGKPEAGWDDIMSYGDGALGAVHRARCRVVTSLCEELRDAVSHESSVALEAVDFGPLWKLGAYDGAWETGFDITGTVGIFDALYVTPYFTSTEQVNAKMREYYELTPQRANVKACLRVMRPDIAGSDDLLAKVDACNPARLKEFGFYNYGLMPLRNLDWIRNVLTTLP